MFMSVLGSKNCSLRYVKVNEQWHQLSDSSEKILAIYLSIERLNDKKDKILIFGIFESII